MPQTVLDTPMGPIGLHWTGQTLTAVDLAPDDACCAARGAADLPTALGCQLAAYLADGSASFDLALDLGGTPFQQRVWAAIRDIPAGSTRTYGDLAAALGTAARAVGQACRANPCPIAVPCHRVVGARGLGGFAGDTSGRRLEVKRRLLRHEGVSID